MLVVHFTKTYTHYIKGTPRWTAQPGEYKTLDREAANYIVNHAKAGEFIGEGCGCIHVDQAIIERHSAHVALATRGITQEEEDAAAEAAGEPEPDPAASKQDGLKVKK